MKCDYNVVKNGFSCNLVFETTEGKVSNLIKCEVHVSYGNSLTFDCEGYITGINVNSHLFLTDRQLENISTTVREVVEEFKVINLL